MMKDVSAFTTCVTCLLVLGGFVACCGAQAIIYLPPGNITACRGSNVTIRCGYVSATTVPVTWMINGTLFDEETLENSPLYQLNIPTRPSLYSLTLLSINHTTTFRCIVNSTVITTSTLGTVTVIDVPVVEMTAIGGCGNVKVSWTVIGNNDACVVDRYTIKFLSSTMEELESFIISNNQRNFSGLSYNAIYYVTVIGLNAIVALSNSVTTSVRTLDLKEPIPNNLAANMKIISIDTISITVSWQPSSCTAANIIKYNITVMDQHSPASVTVPADVLSVEISEFPDSGTSIVANREYTITVSAISDQGTSYPSDPVVINTFILHRCIVTSPSVGTIRVSCDSSHKILVTVTCTNNCTNPMVTINGSSPLTMRGLDPGMMYSVTINVFDGNQVVLSNQTIAKSITVMDDESGTSDSGGSSGGAIAGGVIGGIVAVVVIVIIIIVIYYFCFYKKKSKSSYDDTMNLKSPTGTGRSTASGGDTQTDAFYDKVVYSDPAQTVTVPHQISATGAQYAVSTKAANYANQGQLPSEEYDDTCTTKKDNQGITYADLQDLPTNSEKNMLDDLNPAVTYSQIA